MQHNIPKVTRILFIDIVGFSKKTIHTQQILIEVLNNLVAVLEKARGLSESDRIALPTGDGMALAFFSDPELPVSFAIELQKAIKKHNVDAPPSLAILARMGLNTGEVLSVCDINKKRNIVGDGINNAQRVMDFGDAGHILVSKAIVDDLVAIGSDYQRKAHFAGIFQDKHRFQHHVFNLFDEDFGNPTPPTKGKAVEGDQASPSEGKKHPRHPFV